MSEAESYQVIFVPAFTFDISMATNCIQREVIGELAVWDHKTDLRDKQKPHGHALHITTHYRQKDIWNIVMRFWFDPPHY